MKSKVEPLLSAVNEINNGLTCYSLLNIMTENRDSALCFVQVTSLHEHMRFSRKLSPRFSEAGSNKKTVEMNVYKFFLDMVECIFMDGNSMIS